ncbi:MAG: flagellar motor switch protein FliN [Acidobacteria bacterium]|nr:flagellar motor switch protein FliN [Acidobacteriota bacterium]
MNAEGQWLAEHWAEQLGPSISAMTGADARANRVDSSIPSSTAGGDLWWMQPLNPAPEAALWLVVSEALWREAGQQVLTAAGIEDADEADIRSTFLEVLQQSLSRLASAIGTRLQMEVGLEAGSAQDILPEHLEWHAVEVMARRGVLGKAWLAGSSALLAALEPSADTQPGADSMGRSDPARGSQTLDLLMEVELPVAVSFGRAQMRLKDAVKLTTGSIVELNRSIAEPVEILVNNCVIARGEVVVIEGNYGVRIKQIISREERLRTLF